jgi:fructose/tagatose bisphosphate aldolase
MALVSMRQLLDHAAEHRYGIPAFNVNNMEQLRAVMEAADALDSPVILQGSAGCPEIRRRSVPAPLSRGCGGELGTHPRHHVSGP